MGVKRSAKCLLSLSLGLSLGACWVPKETGQVMQRDIRQLSTEIQASRKGLSEQQAALAEQMQQAQVAAEEQSAAIERKIQDLNRAARKTDAGFGVQLEDMRRELQELRGQNEHLGFQLEKLQQLVGEEGTLTKRIEALEKQLEESSKASKSSSRGKAASKSPTKNSGGASKSPSNDEVPKDKKGMLDHAKGLVKAGKTRQARGVFREIIAKWGKEDGFGDEARFMLGEIYFREKKYNYALQEYISVIEKHSRGNLVDDAYYRIGMCSMELGRFEDARVFFNEIIDKHKSSPLVSQAKGKIKEIDRRLKKK